jgi:hypothetical protein
VNGSIIGVGAEHDHVFRPEDPRTRNPTPTPAQIAHCRLHMGDPRPLIVVRGIASRQGGFGVTHGRNTIITRLRHCLGRRGDWRDVPCSKRGRGDAFQARASFQVHAMLRRRVSLEAEGEADAPGNAIGDGLRPWPWPARRSGISLGARFPPTAPISDSSSHACSEAAARRRPDGNLTLPMRGVPAADGSPGPSHTVFDVAGPVSWGAPPRRALSAGVRDLRDRFR